MVPHAAVKWMGEKLDTTKQMVDRGHFSWVGPYCPALVNKSSPEFRQSSESLVRRMGYQFRLTVIRHASEVAKGSMLVVNVQALNEGVAPFYYNWPVELALL